MRGLVKIALRRIRTHAGRFFAIMLITALGTTFFAGLKVTQPAMIKTLQDYADETHFHDFQIISTVGFTDSAVNAFREVKGVSDAEGSRQSNLLLSFDGRQDAFTVLEITKKTDLPVVRDGRLPETSSECIGDSRFFTSEDIGKTISISGENEKTSRDAFSEKSFKLTGICDNPQYIGIRRGTADVGDGQLKGYIMVPSGAFSEDQPFTSVMLRLEESGVPYSDEYEKLVDDIRPSLEKKAEELAEARWNDILDEVRETSPLTVLASPEDLLKMQGLEKPDVYVLGRYENAGYRSFESDSGIIAGIADIFPVIFILVAILVCMTSVSRLVEEEREQAGTLKALGYSRFFITSGYLIYAGIAGALGWVIGFFFGTSFLPKLFWWAYSVVYDFYPISYYFSLPLALISLFADLGLLLVVTWFSCRATLREAPADLLIPPSPKPGKRILLERFGPLWRRLSFLQKVTLRNTFRYKKRFMMMLVGISFCTALMLMAFGIRDSMTGIGVKQFGGLQKYDIKLGTEPGQADAVLGKAREKIEDISAITAVSKTSEVEKDGKTLDQVECISFPGIDDERLRDFWILRTTSGEDLRLPGKGEVLICEKIAEETGVKPGGTVMVGDSGDRTEMKVAGVFKNYVANHVIFSSEDSELLEEGGEKNALLVSVPGNPAEAASELTGIDDVLSCTRLETTRDEIDNVTKSLNIIIWVVVFFSAILAFVVIFDLTGINLAERKREIATVMVLGFTKKETARYALRESFILSFLGAVIGIPLGVVLHRLVIARIHISMVVYPPVIKPLSYPAAFILTIVFSAVIISFLKRSLNKIKMAESLKARE